MLIDELLRDLLVTNKAVLLVGTCVWRVFFFLKTIFRFQTKAAFHALDAVMKVIKKEQCVNYVQFLKTRLDTHPRGARRRIRRRCPVSVRTEFNDISSGLARAAVFLHVRSGLVAVV